MTSPGLNALQQAALAVQQLRRRVDQLEADRREPIAIVGAACRFPGGAGSLAAYWELLRSGGDAVREVPPDRWDVDRYFDANPDRQGKIYTRHGSFLDGIDRFDAAFFGVSPREAESLDPQQRLLLEVAWEALEIAGQPPDALRDSASGVFVGMGQNDYARRRLFSGADDLIGPYDGTGNGFCFATGRLSHVLGLHGPNMAIDTACSASLVAVHVACQSLRLGECDTALAGGVQLILSPEVTLFLSRARALSPDGRCRTFDAAANGYGRGEGCGLVVLRRLSDARRRGDRVLAVIRGSAVNHSGPTSGLTVPGAAAQEALLRDALRTAALEPDDIDYLEAHGTATSLGDPIEMSAIRNVYVPRDPAAGVLHIGSVKTNVGHLEAAAGIAGLLKVVLALEHGAIPPHLHFAHPNPAIPWEQLPVRVPTAVTPWPADSRRPRRAGVSAFGISGTNAHLVIEEAPVPDPPARADTGAIIVRVSGATSTAVSTLAEAYGAHLASAGPDALEDIAFTANTGRADGRVRLCVVGADAATVSARLNDAALGRSGPGIAAGATGVRPTIGFVYPGQGAQWPGMGRELFAREPVFRRVVEACHAAAGDDGDDCDVGLIDVLYGAAASRLDEIVYTQLGVYAIECGLAALWDAWGITPSSVLGHSVGEYAAAVTAGIFSVEDGARLLMQRARLMQHLPHAGTMAAVHGPVAAVAAAVRASDAVTIAAYNGPAQVVIAGTVPGLTTIAGDLRAAGLTVTPLRVGQGFHSALMDPMLEPFRAAAEGVCYRTPAVAFFSTVTGKAEREAVADARYWVDHVRAPVQFASAVEALSAHGCELIVEIGPKPVLSAMARASGAAGNWLPSLRESRSSDETLLETLAVLYAHGAAINWADVHRARPARRVALPTYPWQRQRYWIEAPSVAFAHESSAPRTDRALDVRRLHSPIATAPVEFEAILEPDMDLAVQHRVRSSPMFPGGGFIEMVVAGARTLSSGAVSLRDCLFHEPLVVRDAPIALRLVFSQGESGARSFEVYSANRSDQTRWTRHAVGRLVERVTEPAHVDLPRLTDRLRTEVPRTALDRALRSRGIDLGSRFQVVDQIRLGDREAIARLSRGVEAGTVIDGALVDGCSALHALLDDQGGGRVLTGIEEVTPYSDLANATWAYVTGDARLGSGETLLLDAGGNVVLAVRGQRFNILADQTQRIPPEGAGGTQAYELAWPSAPLASSSPVDLQALQVSVQDEIDRRIEAASALAHEDAERQLESISADFVLEALFELAGRDGLPRRFSVEALARELGVADRHRRFFHRLIEILAATDVIQHVDGEWELRGPPIAVRRRADPSALAAVHPVAAIECELVGRCGAALADVLREQCDPLALLFPATQGDSAPVSAAALYRDSYAARRAHEIVRTAAARLWPRQGGRRLRVLEIGAGSGSTTEVLLNALPADCDYWFTDVSPVFVRKARGQFADAPNVTFQTLDIERSIDGSNGSGPGTFDLVVASNVLHATRSLPEALANVRELISPGGVLLLVEGTARRNWVDLVFGLTDGWWRFSDSDVRSSHPLLSVAAWRELLAQAGFAESIAWPAGARPGPAGQSVIVARRERAAASAAENWIVISERRDASRDIVETMRRRGVRCTAAATLEPSHAANELDAVVMLAEPDSSADPAAAAVAITERAVSLIADVKKATGTPRIWFVTRGVHDSGSAAGLATAPLWGIARTLALEEPRLWGGIVDLGDRATVDEADRLADELLVRGADDQVAYRDGVRMVPRLRPVRAERGGRFAARSGDTYLITGGLGALGLATAEFLVARGARHLCLVGRRRVASESARRSVEGLRRAGAEVSVHAADVTNVAEIGSVIDAVNRSGHALGGVVHAAGVTGYRALAETSRDEMTAILAPKIQGAWALHQLTASADVQFFMCYSSMVSVWGARGQGPYAAANHFLDALAHVRRAQGLPATTVNWGPLTGGGMVPEDVVRELQRMGVSSTPLESAVDALDDVLTGDQVQPIVVAIDWSRFGELYRTRSRSGIFNLLSAAASPPAATGAPAGRSEVLSALSGERRGVVIGVLRQLLTHVIRDVERLDTTTGLFAMGMDSLGAMEFRRLIEQQLGVSIPSTLLFDCGTLEVLADAVLARMLPAAGVAVSAAVDAIDGLSEIELEALLRRKLDEVG